MRKNFILLVLALLTTKTFAFDLNYGMYLGYNHDMASSNDSLDYSNKLSFSLGGRAVMKYTEEIDFLLNLSYEEHRFKYESEYIEVKYKFDYISLNPQIRYTLTEVPFFFSVGPKVSFNTGAKAEAKLKGDIFGLTSVEQDVDDEKAVVLSINPTIGYEFSETWALDVSYDFALTKAAESSNLKINTLSLNLTYMF